MWSRRINVGAPVQQLFGAHALIMVSPSHARSWSLVTTQHPQLGALKETFGALSNSWLLHQDSWELLRLPGAPSGEGMLYEILPAAMKKDAEQVTEDLDMWGQPR